MLAAASSQAKWGERIARARTLGASRPPAAELLTFYAALAAFQSSLLTGDDLPPAPAESGSEAGRNLFFEGLDIDRVLDAIPQCLSWLPHAAPRQLVESIDLVRRYERDDWRDLAGRFIDTLAQGSSPASSDGDRLILFVVETVLQPFAGQRAIQLMLRPNLDSRAPMHCPRCAALPVAAVLREEGQGAKRFLLCALCLTEWECLRIVCPACGEQQFDKLPVYTAEQFAHVRVDACDRCRRYVKTVDLTKDGLAVPCVDDIASVSLDLWARERGYDRLKSNVLGL
jgi:FdhE protein